MFLIDPIKNPQFQQQNQRHQHRHGKIELTNNLDTIADDVENNLPLLFEVHFRSQVLKFYYFNCVTSLLLRINKFHQPV